ncbi:SIS domain-containing protein [Rubellimicrobium sp. CFH 75288]|uniref:SIS domain-containing protein n=1 Tax=Rubellimicrobium sp. CFH 75288 TaxID=2697034 RepID=UPI001412EF83|nr:SIS domain-containing protein [Rubellimicrobium sp. CFH 75288]NAZ35889.1 sugar isomerase domain-containing protein [Rubellimicrobium sp. CFH 75288]
MTGTAQAYLREMSRRLGELAEAADLGPAVEAIAASVRAGGLTYVFGTGHSHLLALELHYRAGGPAFVVPVLDEPLMLHEGAVASTLRERESGVAAEVLGRYAIGPGDVLIVVSNSGVNAVPVEAARAGRSRGATVIALTSLDYSTTAAAGRPTLAGEADIVLDNRLPPGDALVALPGTSLRAGPGSTAIGAALLHAVFAEVAARLATEGAPPLYLSANMPGAGDNNRELVERFRPRNPHL